MRYLVDQKQKFACLSNCRYCADRAQNVSGPSPAIYTQECRTREHHQIAPYRVNPIFGRSLASSRITTRTMMRVFVGLLRSKFLNDICHWSHQSSHIGLVIDSCVYDRILSLLQSQWCHLRKRQVDSNRCGPAVNASAARCQVP